MSPKAEENKSCELSVTGEDVEIKGRRLTLHLHSDLLLPLALPLTQDEPDPRAFQPGALLASPDVPVCPGAPDQHPSLERAVRAEDADKHSGGREVVRLE